MFKYLFLILSVFILFLECKSSKDINTIVEHEKTEVELLAELDAIIEGLTWNEREALENHNMLGLEGFYGRIAAIDDFSPLALLTNLEELQLTHFEMIDISFVSKLTNLKKLVLVLNREIKNVASISNLSNLEVLSVQSSKGIDISFIENLVNLRELSLSRPWYEAGGITDISPLSNLNNLRRLRLTVDDTISDISPIMSLENLEYLELSGDGISDITPVANLKNLKHLKLNYLGTGDISPISNLEMLESLSISSRYIAIENFAPVSGLLNLKHLFLEFTPHFDLSYVRYLQNLETLQIYLIDNPKLNFLANLHNLGDLDIVGSNIGDLTTLAMLPNLENLRIFGNENNGEFIGGSKAINIMPLAASNSLKYITTGFTSWESLADFKNNKGKIFEEKGIHVYSQDLR